MGHTYHEKSRIQCQSRATGSLTKVWKRFS
jgi:hypothetical protein